MGGGNAVSGFHATVLTLYPEMFPGPLSCSLAGSALSRGLWRCDVVNIREFGSGVHRSVDDTPAGGGPGMVLRADIVAAAVDAAVAEDDPRARIVLSARGRPFTQSRARRLAQGPGVVLLCGHFEG
ncbi:MAG: tRNA (guanosine(37)-N1)-methyltransferase TrmD, partial [Methylobacteriaceae bacterium]|nr:tRNA (guanosine(37)-N1)-methyltransferase TrmD [Methylobacteriaceae bacterium]